MANSILVGSNEQDAQYTLVPWGQPMQVAGLEFKVKMKDSLNQSAIIPGQYSFEVFSPNRLVTNYSGSDLNVRMLDKDVSILKLYFRHKVPLKAKRFLNALIDAYIEDFVENKAEAAGKALTFIEEELKGATKELEEVEQKIVAYKGKMGIYESKKEAEQVLVKLQDLAGQKLSLEMEQTQYEKLSNYLETAQGEEAFAPDYGSIQDPIFREGLLKLTSLQVQRREMLLTYTEEHPSVKLLDQEFSTLQEQLKEGLFNTRQTQVAKLSAVDASIGATERNLNSFPRIERDLISLNRKFYSSQKKYEFLQQKREEAAIGAAATIAFHKILARADLPQSALSLQRKAVIVISFLLGLMLAISIILVRQYLRGVVVLPEDLALHTDTSVIGTLPKNQTNFSKINEKLYDLAAGIQLAGGEKVLSITAWQAKAKKEHTACLLAQAYAEMGQKTLLIDADLSHPKLHKSFLVAQDPGFVEWVQSEGQELDAVRPSDIPHLSIMPVGNLNVPAAAVLMDDDLPHRLQTLAKDYDKVIIHAPVLETGRFGIPLLKAADLSLVVARNDFTKLAGVKAVASDLASQEIAAAWVWNPLPRTSIIRAWITQKFFAVFGITHKRYRKNVLEKFIVEPNYAV